MNKTQLDLEFEEIYKKANIEIKKRLSIAIDALAEAVEISEKYCIPFNSKVSFIEQEYRPSEFNNKWSSIDRQLVYSLTDCDSLTYSGWQHSQVC